MAGGAPTDPRWRPSAPLDHLRRRAGILRRIREFFHERGVWEVETPILSAAATTDPNLHSLSTTLSVPGAPEGRRYYLHTSPEFPMKRLLAAGSGPIYQIARVFRNDEVGPWHNPEFTLLEWYRPGFDLPALMAEVVDLLHACLKAGQSDIRLGDSLYLSYREAFQRYAGIDPHTATETELADCAACHDLHVSGADWTRDEWLDLIISHVVQPAFPKDRPVLVHGYPASQAALARIRPGDPPVAERFELFLAGMELANGFHELTDANEQRRRFEADLAGRRTRGLPKVPMDENLLKALENGLPDCSGVAVGVDRLVMAITNTEKLQSVMAFPADRA